MIQGAEIHHSRKKNRKKVYQESNGQPLESWGPFCSYFIQYLTGTYFLAIHYKNLYFFAKQKF